MSRRQRGVASRLALALGSVAAAALLAICSATALSPLARTELSSARGPVQIVFATPTPAPAPTGPLAGRHVCVDAGHGGEDPGAVYADLRESDVALEVAQRLAALLRAHGARVTLTRTGDSALGNSERAFRCDAVRVEVLVSVHLNASEDTSLNFAQVIYGTDEKDLELARTIDANFALRDGVSADPLPHLELAALDNGMLLRSRVPAVMVETVFLSNPHEQALLAAGKRQSEIAEGIARGLLAWLAR